MQQFRFLQIRSQLHYLALTPDGLMQASLLKEQSQALPVHPGRHAQV